MHESFNLVFESYLLAFTIIIIVGPLTIIGLLIKSRLNK